MPGSLFQLPDELVLTTLAQTFPCRDTQIRTLATLVYPTAAPCQNIILYGTESTGKTAVASGLLELLDENNKEEGPTVKFAIVNSIECITPRHLFESLVGRVADALQWETRPPRCETVSQLAAELSKMLKYTPRPETFRFVLVFDGIDRQRDAPATLLPALARLSEIIPCITSVFIVTLPQASFLRTPFVHSIHFPNYTKAEFVAILATSPPPVLSSATKEETTDLWTRFTGAVHDALARAASRTLPAFRHACTTLWPRFTAPILAGTHGPREFSKLLIAARAHFQDERLLDPGIVALTTYSKTGKTTDTLPVATSQQNGDVKALGRDGGSPVEQSTDQDLKPATAAAGHDLATLLPTTARILLLAAYLASHNPTRHDLTLFSTHHHGRRRRRGGLSVGVGRGGGRSKHRKISRKLLGAHAFVLERMLAIFVAVRREWDPKSTAVTMDSDATMDLDAIDSDISMAIATLASLRLLTRVGGGGAGSADPMDHGGKWRVNVGWEVVKGLGRSIGVEVDEWLIE
ncbi:origin recognition complex subunit 5 C-terminus-domain-containing protein [Rhypophila decipiens]|uniref:Origin recognition complex subunit 5 C-terminus-domain-containing protein n=1 Tax=Rhypophila decipiens TaxID=261697 RepID=A0AAN6Y9U5_9PEZI|nr:origin recognition complex subunit 5 C-terminus-domain-containing protein [Rhypophila decipiens]